MMGTLSGESGELRSESESEADRLKSESTSVPDRQSRLNPILVAIGGGGAARWDPLTGLRWMLDRPAFRTRVGTDAERLCVLLRFWVKELRCSMRDCLRGEKVGSGSSSLPGWYMLSSRGLKGPDNVADGFSIVFALLKPSASERSISPVTLRKSDGAPMVGL